MGNTRPSTLSFIVMSRTSRMTFTINNFTDDHRIKIGTLPQDYHVVAGGEVARTGTPHIQGAVIFPQVKSWSQVKTLLGANGAHLEKMGGTWAHQLAYCQKGEQSHEEFTELGVDGPNYGLNADIIRADQSILDTSRILVERNWRQMLRISQMVQRRFFPGFGAASQALARLLG